MPRQFVAIRVTHTRTAAGSEATAEAAIRVPLLPLRVLSLDAGLD